MKTVYKNVIDLGRNTGQIMEINVNSTSTAEVLTRVEDFISDSRQFYIVTPNPELILMAQTNENLRNALNEADIAVPDGVGLKIANPDLQIIKGRELFLELVKLTAKKKWKIFLLGGLGEEAKLAASKLQITISRHFPNYKLQINYNPGPMLDSEGRPLSDRDVKIERDVKNQINEFKPELLFVAYGNPKQEIWVHDNLSKLKVGGAMCIGGTLRYVAGQSILPPKFLSGNGLEWLWRGLTEPKRIGRIFRAVVVFPIRYFIYSCSRP